MYTFDVNIHPQPKERPRFNRKTGLSFTPKRTREYETTLRNHLLDVFHHDPLHGAVGIDLTFAVEGIHVELWEPNKPQIVLRADVDNLAKSFLDAAQGVLYVNDSQIVCLKAHK